MEKVIFLLILFSLTAGGSIQYVRPNAPPSEACPGQPCLTLDQYIRNTSRYFTTGATFVFLPGNHSLETSLNIISVSNITFTSENSSTAVIVKCTRRVAVHNVTGMTIEGMKFLVVLASQEKVLSAFAFSYCREVVVYNSEFRIKGGAILALITDITVQNCLFEGVADSAIYTQQGTTMTLTGNNFTRVIGGAVYSEQSSLLLRGNDFSHNVIYGSGGAIYCSRCAITTMDFNNFNNNSAIGYRSSAGGAIALNKGKITVIGSANFSRNTATKGGAISLTRSRADFGEGSKTIFEENSALNVGGGMFIGEGSVIQSNTTLIFNVNTAKGSITYSVCGVMCVFNIKAYHPANYLSATLVNNTGTTGGALFIEKTDGLNLTFIHARNNMGDVLGIQKSTQINVLGANFTENSNANAGVVTMSSSNVTFLGNCTFDRNTGAQGAISLTNDSCAFFRGNSRIINNIGRSGAGGMVVIESQVVFSGNTLFHNNSGVNGGALYTEKGRLDFQENTTIIGNSATTYGGGIYASSSSSVNIESCVKTFFSHNSAISGGAMYFTSGANLTLGWYSELITTHNTATEYGGALYHQDSISIVQCSNVTRIIYQEQDKALTIPYSFLQLTFDIPKSLKEACPNITSYNDSAGEDGNFLYGGLLDRSRLSNVPHSLPYDYYTSFCNINVSPQNNETNTITSDPFQLSFCDVGDLDSQTNISVYRGETFRLHLVGLGQGKSTVPSTVTAFTNPTAQLKLNQSSQYVTRQCTEVTYNLYSTKNYEELTVFPTDGPCQTIGEASTVIHVTLRPCPDAFNLSNEQCVCEDRLKEHNATCEIEDDIFIWRNAGLKYWMNASYSENGSYEGLILYPSCPSGYCTTDTVSVSLDNPDIQCALNRSGVLCGKCATNNSLLLGGSRCDVCSNVSLVLILPFALAGVVLIVALSFLKLTVASGTINSLILYANFVQVNKSVFFNSNRLNVLTLFISWMNLDLGIETCFFDSMDVYAQTWLQFVFPLYVWILISLIILCSRYSVTVSKLTGSNPVAVLATLLLMSYNKILKVIIDVFSSVNLLYPHEKKVAVWLKDGNLPFLDSKHLYLSLFTLLVSVFFFLPYTLFLLLGHLLYRLPYRKYYNWLLMKIKPLLDSYYAPYKVKTRYWTGFFLLFRCVLYILFSFNSLGGTSYSLLAIIIAFSGVGTITWLAKGIYRHFYMDVIEVSIYMNLITLSASAAILPETYKELITYILVGIVFVKAFGIVVYQIHLRYLSKSALWRKIKAKIPCLHKPPTPPTEHSALIQNTGNTVKGVSRTFISLREPLLEN